MGFDRLKWQYQLRPDLDPYDLGKNFDSGYGFSESGKRCWECMFSRGHLNQGRCIIDKVWPLHKRCFWFRDMQGKAQRAKDGPPLI